MNDLAPDDATMTDPSNPRRCWECGYYSFKVYGDQDNTSGKCFRDHKTLHKVYWVDGLMTCPGFIEERSCP